MKKIHFFLNEKMLFALFISFSLLCNEARAQVPLCGPIVENFDNTGGSTAGFTGDFTLGTTGSDGYLVRNRVIASGIYTITTPTYQLPAIAGFIGYGFIIGGTERTARIEVAIMYVSTLTNEMTTIFLGQFVPTYGSLLSTAEVCRAIAISDLPGFPVGGRYRFRIEQTPNTGSGTMPQNITFDDFRTNGVIAILPLPVNFISVDAKRADGFTQVTWKVAGEENVDHYAVERSEDGRHFVTIAQVPRNGKDTYTYNDATGNSDAYYRVKNVDRDGAFKYSTIVRFVQGKSNVVVKAFPQPVTSQLTIQHSLGNNKTLISISSADGRVVRSQKPVSGSMQTTVDMNDLQKGVYIVRFDDGSGTQQTLKIVKQ